MSPERLNGRDFRALRRLSNPEDETLADVGELCERVPGGSLAALVESGDIELAVERRASAPPVPAPAEPDRRTPRSRR